MIKDSINQEDMTIINIHTWLTVEPQNTWSKNWQNWRKILEQIMEIKLLILIK